MRIDRGKFYLDNLIFSKDTRSFNNKYGQSIYTVDNKENIKICDIIFDQARLNCYIKTVGSNLQDYITSFDDYSDFVYLVDEAYDSILRANGVKN